ncbi:MAG TPA: tetratricopeptide repeat protein, partial [Candidatus Babeliaceae bacterium]|nr:tetratricopeptide repeat protein [Candidatus Babeliaceae bacterium]
NYLQKAYRIRVALAGENSNDPDIAESSNNLGLILKDLGRYEEALVYLEKAFTIWNSLFGPNHTLVALSLFNSGGVHKAIGKIHRNVEEIKKGLALYQKGLETWVTLYRGDPHPYIAKANQNIGSAHQEIGTIQKNRDKIQTGLDFYQIALTLSQDIYKETPAHPDIAEIYNNMGSAYEALGQREDALTFFQQAINIWLNLYGPIHLNIGVGYNNMGWAYQGMGNFKKALEFYEKGWNILVKFYDTSHPTMRIIQSNMTNIRAKGNL